MKRAKKLYILLGVLAVALIATFVLMRHQERVEQIKNSGETILTLPTDSIQSVSWEQNDTTLAFHRGENWIYDADEAFPVDGEKIDNLLSRFENFAAAFIIEDVDDFGQYGLNDPVCTIDLEAGDESYTVTLGNFSNLDEQRYVSIGDGNVYLVADDPMDTFEAQLSDFIRNDEIPSFDTVSGIQFSGKESWSLSYEEDSADTYCADDVYFTQRDGKNRPLDTTLVKNYLSKVSGMDQGEYATYNATAEELASYGLDNPALTVTVDYEDEDGKTGAFTLHVSPNPEEKAAAEEAEANGEEEVPEVTGYARVGESQIVYKISAADCGALLAGGYDDLRHTEVLSADFADITQIDVTLENVVYTLTAEGEGDDRTWKCGEQDVDITDFQSALEALKADSFTSEAPTEKEEIRLTVHLDNENFPEVEIVLYRYDGASCLAVVDGESVSLVARSDAVDLIEAVNAIVLH